MTNHLDHLLERVALALYGSPNSNLSSKDQLRFGTHGSLSVEIGGKKRGQWFDHEMTEGGGTIQLVQKKLGLSLEEANRWVRDRFQEVEKVTPSIEATYDYLDDDGSHLFQTVRRLGKRFSQRRRGSNGQWVNNLGKTKRVPYNLPAVLKTTDETIFVVEGEKDVETLRTAGFIATCSPGGAAKPTPNKPYRSKWRSEFSDVLRAKTVVVIPDNDEAGRAHANSIVLALNGIAKSVSLLALPGLPPKGDVSDWLNGAGNTDELRRLADLVIQSPPIEARTHEASTPDSWVELLKVRKDGQTLQNHANLLIAFRNDPAWRDVVFFDELRSQAMLRRPVPKAGQPTEMAFPRPEPWNDLHDSQALEWFQMTEFPTMRPDTVARAARQFAEDCSEHPIRDYLINLTWDGIPRLQGGTTPHGEIIESMLPRYFGAASNDYSKAVARIWLISMIARVFEPGCKVDTVIILEGTQGTGKSSACRILAGETYFSDNLPSFVGKDASDHCRGKWLIEISELTAFRRTDIEAMKAFLSRQIDSYRPVYARHEINYERQCVFIGTTNQSEYLRDETGGRRFLPITTTNIDLPQLAADRDQLFAEAVHLYRNREPWHIADPKLVDLAQREQSARFEDDVWAEKIADFVSGKSKVKVPTVLEHLEIYAGQQDPRHQRRVKAILRHLGWTPKRSKRERYWQPPLGAAGDAG